MSTQLSTNPAAIETNILGMATETTNANNPAGDGAPLSCLWKKSDLFSGHRTRTHNSLFSAAQTRNSDGRQQETKEYTDADLARDMNSMSFAERQIISEDIHGVSFTDLPPETPEFIASKVKELLECLNNMPNSRTRRGAWDRAKYLRPTLAKDTDHFLMFLRAKRYDAFNAAQFLLKYYESKMELWGDDLLLQRITWNDLSEHEQEIVRSGVTVILPKNHPSANGEGLPLLRYVQLCQFDTRDELSLIKAALYPGLEQETNTKVQRVGRIVVVDSRGAWKSSHLRFVEFLKNMAKHLECVPLYTLAYHFLVADDSIISPIGKAAQLSFSRRSRVRTRWHFGSWMELQYSLRTFGIHIPCDPLTTDHSSLQSPFSRASIEQSIQKRQYNDEQWRAVEAPYQHPKSLVALYPNRMDMIMGWQRTVTATWPGNLRYHQLIDQYAALYLAEEARSKKKDVAFRVFQILDGQCSAPRLSSSTMDTSCGGGSVMEEDPSAPLRSRFLVRKEELWEALSDEDALNKVAQSLRDEARKLLQQMKKSGGKRLSSPLTSSSMS